MSVHGFDNRLREIREIREDYPISYRISIVSFLIIVVVGLGFIGIGNFWQNLFPNLISVALTVGILDVIDQYRQKQKQSALHNILNWNYGKNPNAPITHRIFFEMIIYDALSGRVTSYFDISDFKC